MIVTVSPPVVDTTGGVPPIVLEVAVIVGAPPTNATDWKVERLEIRNVAEVAVDDDGLTSVRRPVRSSRLRIRNVGGGLAGREERRRDGDRRRGRRVRNVWPSGVTLTPGPTGVKPVSAVMSAPVAIVKVVGVVEGASRAPSAASRRGRRRRSRRRPRPGRSWPRRCRSARRGRRRRPLRSRRGASRGRRAAPARPRAASRWRRGGVRS